jgi:deoxyribonuclease V
MGNMDLRELHAWQLTPQVAIALQLELANRLEDGQPLNFAAIETVAGVDVSVKDNMSQAAVVVMTFPDLTPIETVTVSLPTPFPYVPGLLTFREGPVLVKAFEQLQHEPDVFIFDGMGRIHPRRMGIAAHMGLWLNRPTMGVGKTHFIGEYDTPAVLRGSYSHLTDKGEVVGAVLRTRDKVKSVYISAGHLMDLESAILLAMACTTKYRLPRPIRLAHDAAGKH